MRNLIKFYVEPYKSTHKRAINAVLGLGYIFKKHPPGNILEKKFWRSIRNYKSEENRDLKALHTEKIACEKSQQGRIGGSWWNYNLVLTADLYYMY